VMKRFYPSAPVSTTGQSVRYSSAPPLTVHELRPAWSRVLLCRYILKLKARIRELEAELAGRV
jgi:hypothetical protein